MCVHRLAIMKIIDWMIVIGIVCDLITFPTWRCRFSSSSPQHERDFLSATRIQYTSFASWEYRANVDARHLSFPLSFERSSSSSIVRCAKIRHLLHSVHDSTSPTLNWRFSWCAICIHWTFSLGIRFAIDFFSLALSIVRTLCFSKILFSSTLFTQFSLHRSRFECNKIGYQKDRSERERERVNGKENFHGNMDNAFCLSHAWRFGLFASNAIRLLCIEWF